jgi:hypothetical protein
MPTTTELVRRIYAFCLSLYPKSFREAFADEMKVVFAEAAFETRRRGILALGGMVARELHSLLAGATREYWHTFSQKEAIMSETLEISGGAGTLQVDKRGGHEPGSWKKALLAGLPHLLIAILTIIPTLTRAYELIPSAETVSTVLIITIAVAFVILIGVVLFTARRQGWPSWTASWYLYVLVLVAIPLLLLIQLIGDSFMQDFLGILMFVLPVLAAVLLFEVTRRNRLKEVLIALPLLVFLWNALQEFVPPHVDVFLSIWGWTLAALAAVLIVRYDNWRLGVWSFLGLNLLVGASAAYTYVYQNNFPFQYAPDKTIFAVVEYFAPQFLVFSTLVLGPLLVWMLREIGRRSGPMGVPGYRLMFWGLLAVMVCSLGAFYIITSAVPFEYRDAGVSLFATGAALGGLASLLGALVLGTAAMTNKTLTSIWTTVLVVGVPLGLPWIFALVSDVFGMGIWLLVPLKYFPISVAYMVGLVWVLLAAWLVSSRCWEPILS